MPFQKKGELGALKLPLRSCEATWNNWNPEMTISQEHFFQLSMRKCDVSGRKSWIWPLFMSMQYWISPNPIFHTGLATECLVKKLTNSLVMTFNAWSLEIVRRVLSYFGRQYLQRNAGPRGGYTCISYNPRDAMAIPAVSVLSALIFEYAMSFWC